MQSLNTQQHNFILPAEWAPQSGIQLTWPHEKTDWNDCLDEIAEVFIKLTYEISKREFVLIVTPDPETVWKKLKSQIPQENHRHIIIHKCDTDDTWARDHAPLTLISTKTSQGFFVQNYLLDFRFNGWGEKFASQNDNDITKNLYYNGLFNGTLINCNDFVLEGGSIESDGKGTIFTTTCCMLAPHRNQPMRRIEIENRLKSALHAERIIWLEHGRLIGDDTDGHIDTIVRTAPGDTLLYVGCDDHLDEHYEDFKLLETQLQSLTTLKGEAYRLIKLPMPSAIYHDDERLPATYANFIILNRAVIFPTYGQHDKDKEAEECIRKAFPDREIIGIDARIVIRQHGSLHCLTMQYPQGVIGNNSQPNAFF